MEEIVVIQARMGSSRLPGKAMLPLDGTPAIVHEINRAAQVDGINRTDVVVATSQKPSDDILECTAEEAGATVYRGSESNVIGRIANAVEYAQADIAVRMCGDNTLISPHLLMTLLRRVRNGEISYASTKFERTFPIGHNADAFTREQIVRAAANVESEYHMQHVAQYFKDHREEIPVTNVAANEIFPTELIELPPSFPELRLTLDEADDYRLLKRLYDEVSYDDVLDTADAIRHVVGESLYQINCDVEQEVW